MSTRGGREVAELDLRRDRLYDALASGFAATGYGASSIDDLCEWTGYGRGALYRHIESKSAALWKVTVRYLEELERRVARVEDAGPPEVVLRSWAEAVLSAQHDRNSYAKVFFHEKRALSPEQSNQVDTRLRDVNRSASRALQALPSNGLTLRAREGAFFGMVYGSYLWYRPDGVWKPAELAVLACEICLRGVVGPAP